MIGKTISHYRIVEKLGEGGMGVVYIAEDTLLGRRVAIKTLTAGRAAQEPHFRSRFLREARAVSALSHPHIATIHDYGETEDGEPYIVMELIKGKTLGDLALTETLTIPRAIEIIAQVAEALAEAHRHGIVHRDIKPSNVVINERGNVKVLDFGLAKQIDVGAVSPTDTERQTLLNIQTREGMIVGTPMYLSPEQALGVEVDARSDLFTLGGLLYECIAGKPPFFGRTAGDICAKIIRDDPPPPSQFNADIPKELDRIALKALAKQPEERYQTADELISDLGATRSQLLGLDRTIVRAISPAPVRSPTGTLATLSDIFRRPRLSVGYLSIGLLAIVVLVAAWWYVTRARRNQPANAYINSIAVLPFANANEDPEIEYLCDGLTESLINNFSQLPSMRVIARSSAFRYKAQEINPQSVGRELKVQALLIGRVVKHGDDFFINMELVDVEQDSRIWGAKYDRKLLDLLSTQAEITRSVTDKLRPGLGSEQSELLAGKHTKNSEAYQLYLKGRYYWNKQTVDGFDKAFDYFQQAIQKDPRYGLAYVGLADTYLVTARLFSEETSSKATEAILKALAIDNNLAEAHASLGFVKGRYDWNWSEAEKEYKRAIELDPNYSNAYYFYAEYLEILGREDEALTVLKKGQEIDPFSALISTELGVPLFYQRRYDQAIDQFHKALELEPNFWHPHYWLGLAYYQKGMVAESIKELQMATSLSGERPSALAMLGYVYASSGKRDKALESLAKLNELSNRRVLPFYMAVIDLGLGERDQVFKWLARSYEERDPALVQIKELPLFEGLRQDPRISDLIRRMGLAP